MSKSVIVIEDEFLIAEDFIAMCTEIGLEVLGNASDSEEAERLIRDKQPDYVLMDVRIKGKTDGVEVARKIYDVLPDIKFIFVTGSNEQSTIDRINTDHPYAILAKPVSFEKLRDTFN
ncbi:MAG: response regulator [Henriciella sp.]|uniref:response regulator n=1 Tax=Henriciella sp. TaxID=1968823 RepID=UPI003C77FE5B